MSNVYTDLFPCRFGHAFAKTQTHHKYSHEIGRQGYTEGHDEVHAQDVRHCVSAEGGLYHLILIASHTSRYYVYYVY